MNFSKQFGGASFSASLILASVLGVAQAQPTQLKTLAAARGITIGAAISFPGSGRAAFDTLISRNFGGIVGENAMKFGNIQTSQGTFSWTAADQLVDFAVAHNMKIRYHNFIWHQQSSFMANGTSGPAANSFDRAGAFVQMRNHINTVMNRYKTRNPGVFDEWDVVNEAVARDSLGMRLGSGASDLLSRWVTYTQGETNDYDYVDSAFAISHRADSSARLVYNDYDAEGMGVKAGLVFSLVSKLKNRGIPLDVVGMQCHWHLNQAGTTSNGGWNASEMAENMKRIAALGLRISITELDIRIVLPADSAKLAQQRQAYETVMSLCLAQPACKNFYVWGVHDGNTWITSKYSGFGAPLLFTASPAYTPKPAYDGLISVMSTTAIRAPGARSRAVDFTPAGAPYDIRGRQMKSLPAGPSFKVRKSAQAKVAS